MGVATERRIATSLFHLLRCLFKDSHGALLVSHDYGGASRFRQSFGLARGGYERGLSEDWMFLLADPGDSISMQILASLGAFSGSVLAPPGYVFAFGTGHFSQSLGTDPFTCLPPEILGMILIRLPSADVCHLRLASAAVAGISSPPSLSQSFWKSRFTADFEMAFFFPDSPRPAHHPKVVDWRALYALIQTSLGGGPLAEGLQNRRRIWNCLAHVFRPLEPLLDAGNRGWLLEDLPPAIAPLQEHQQCGNAVQSHAQHHHASQYFPFRVPAEASRLRISVFFIEFNCLRYISGVALQSRDGDDFTTLHQVGIGTTAGEHLELNKGEVVDGMKIHSAMDGLVGFELYLRGKKSRNASIGHCSGSYTDVADVAVAELLATEPGVLCGLILTFDVRSLSKPRATPPPLPLTRRTGLQMYRCPAGGICTLKPGLPGHGSQQG